MNNSQEARAPNTMRFPPQYGQPRDTGFGQDQPGRNHNTFLHQPSNLPTYSGNMRWSPGDRRTTLLTIFATRLNFILDFHLSVISFGSSHDIGIRPAVFPITPFISLN